MGAVGMLRRPVSIPPAALSPCSPQDVVAISQVAVQTLGKEHGGASCCRMILGEVMGVKSKVPSQTLPADWWMILGRGKYGPVTNVMLSLSLVLPAAWTPMKEEG